MVEPGPWSCHAVPMAKPALSPEERRKADVDCKAAMDSEADLATIIDSNDFPIFLVRGQFSVAA